MQLQKILKYIEENRNSAFFYTPNIINDAKSYFFKNPFKIMSGNTLSEIEEILNEVDTLSQDPDLIGFAAIPYEIGYYFQPKEIKNLYLKNADIKFLFYKKENVEIIDSENLSFDDAEKYIKSDTGIKNFELDITKEEYVEKINKIKKYITEGDTYQINFTTKAKFKYDGELSSLFMNGIFNQSAGYSVLINDEDNFILSFSPELFFETDYNYIYSKPMKGTLKRKGNPAEDVKLPEAFLQDEKNLAENVMIVDLMRNDIGRIAETDSVKVKKLYEVEKYETLYQLTSTVVGKLQNTKLSEIFKNLFPSGSITGAPKIRSMQIIAELEKAPRKLYTGSIGLISNERSVFNIPIRTISINKTSNEGELGLGSGIVWDSDAENEYEEVLLKGRFINSPQRYFELLEAMLYENGEYFLLDYHFNRLKSTAEYFLFKYDANKINNALKGITAGLAKNKKYKVQLILSKWGNIKLETHEIKTAFEEAKIILTRLNRCSEEKFLYHKTTYRPWDEQFKIAAKKGFDEVLFLNENNELLEGAITNLLIEKNGKWYTPPISLDILNGCYRQYRLDNKTCEEKILKVDDLKNADKIILCNSVRKEIIVNRIYNLDGELVYKS